MPNTEITLKSELILHNRVFDYERREVRLPDGNVTTREVIQHRGGVAVAALDENDRLLMVRQFRAGVGQELLELPAGKLEAGEDPVACGKRELEEECGFRTETLTLLAEMFPTPAYSSERIRIYRAGKLLPGTVHLDEDEFVTPVWVPFSEALDRVLAGEIPDAKTQIGILRLDALRRQEEV